jgi:hypothetical protein
MPEINSLTLVIAIRAVAAEIRAMRAALADGEAEAEEFQALEDYERAAEDLERAYEITARTVINLPPYDELIGDSEDDRGTLSVCPLYNLSNLAGGDAGAEEYQALEDHIRCGRTDLARPGR